MADVTINELVSQAPGTNDLFPFATAGVTPSTYKASLAQIKAAMAIPAAQIQSDWTQTNTGSLDYIKNKPTIPKFAWARFNGSGQIQDSFGVTSIAPNAPNSNVYLVDVTAAGFSNANYSITGMTRYNGTTCFMQLYTGDGGSTSLNPTTTRFYVTTTNSSVGQVNHTNYIQVMGN